MMQGILSQLPYLEQYGHPSYFLYVILTIFPIFIGLFYKRRFPIYEHLVSILMIVLMFGGAHSSQLVAFFGYFIWQMSCVFFYKWYRKRYNHSSIFYLTIIVSLLPLVMVKILPLVPNIAFFSIFSFLGISYLSFKSIGTIIELRDGILTDFSLISFSRFMLFFPTFSSGPIDRFKRFEKDYHTIPDKETLLDMLEKAINYILIGFLYKYIFSYTLGSLLLPEIQEKALSIGGLFNGYTLLVMYVYGLNLFFDFAGYSMFALAISFFMGIQTPNNFNKPFLSPNLKEFWNRWHMSLSFWFRDYVFMRLVHLIIRKKKFQNRNFISGSAYLVNMLLMGFWHGITWYYIAYGLFHAVGLILTDAWLRKKKTINRKRKNNHEPLLFEGKLFHIWSIVLTFHVVMFSLLLFSGFLNSLWFN